MSDPKILILDIETSPHLAYVWGLFQQNVALSQLHTPTEMLCFAGKWYGKRGTFFHSGDYDPRGGDTQAMVAAAHELLSEADVVMHYNGRTFDIPHLNREFLEHGFPPPAPYQQIDLYQTVRKRFRFASSKLDHISHQLGVGGKVKHEGFDLWRKCLQGDESAWKRMERYNRQDVVLLEPVYEQLRPWVPAHPSHAAFQGRDDICTACGSEDLAREGFSLTAQGKFQRFRCRKCNKWTRSTKRVDGVSTREVVL